MARTRSAQTQTVTIDAIDQLVTQLNEISGIEFVRDAWLNKAPENYGVVELSGEASQLWADGHLLDSVYRVLVHLYVKGDDDSWPAQVQEKLEALESTGKVDLTHTNTRDFDYQTGKVHWMWSVSLYGPLTWTESVAVEGDA